MWDKLNNLSHMQKLGSTNVYRMMLFSTSCDFPSITAQAFSAILAASETSSYVDVAKYYILTTDIHRSTEWFFIFRLMPVLLWFAITCRSKKPKYKGQIGHTEGAIVYITAMSHMCILFLIQLLLFVLGMFLCICTVY